LKIQLPDKENAIVKNLSMKKLLLKTSILDMAEENVLKNFSLEVPKGKTVALVGQSGSGKSTIANLLTRFYDVQEGSVKIDGIDVKDMTLESLKRI
jgi:subfamily B ATP-binding cassette protein MsbA